MMLAPQWPLRRVISGMQTGADLAGVKVGKLLGYTTGGYMPKGFKTEVGPRPEYAVEYNAIEMDTANYAARTIANVHAADGTIVIGKLDSPGCRLTIRTCRQQVGRYPRRPFMLIESIEGLLRPPQEVTPVGHEETAQAIHEWIIARQIVCLNVAGNRESTNPGIEQRVHVLLMRALRPLEG